MNRQLFEPMGLNWKFLPQELSVFQEDEEQRAQSLQALVAAGVPLDLALEMLGFTLPEGWEYSDLAEPEPEPQPQIIDVTPTQQPPPMLGDRQADEVRKFRKWAGKRANPDPENFDSDILTAGQKRAILDEMGDGAAVGAPFPVADVAEWDNYP